MLSVGNTLGSSGGSLSLDARVAVGAGVFAVGAAETVTEPSDVSPTPQRLPAYNAHEFTYRSDIGKIILLQQNVETGQAVTQIPTEYHLRQYAANQRDQRLQQQQKLYKSSGGESQETQVAAVNVEANSVVSPGASSASPPASPSVAPSSVAAATVAHVDIKA